MYCHHVDNRMAFHPSKWSDHWAAHRRTEGTKTASSLSASRLKTEKPPIYCEEKDEVWHFRRQRFKKT